MQKGGKMEEAKLNDIIIDIFQSIGEQESLIRILKEAINNENDRITMPDISNALEIILSKHSNIKLSLDRYIDLSFNKN